MRIIKKYKVPTGDILIVNGEKGKLEMLSIGDYGKKINVKADFLGLKEEPKPVKHTKLLPLEQKWVITIHEEDTSRITCGNAILAGNIPK